jgi:hypothetical protein
MTTETGGPRRHHYDFAHRALPSIMLNPDVDLAQLASVPDRLNGALRATWQRVGDQLGESDRIPDDGLAVELRLVDGVDALLVTLPPALNQAEAIFVLIMPLEPATERRLFTLESGWDVVNRRTYTVLGSWTDAGHLNLGEGPSPDPDAFIAAISTRMRLR